MKQAYKEQRFNKSSLELIENANAVIAEYRGQGYKLTLRQLYYQMVVMNLIPNKVKEYRRLASVLNDARWAGLVDWDAIEDRARNTHKIQTWDNPRQIAEAAFYSYREDYWLLQDCHVEVFCEKDAVSNIIEPICRELRVAYTANKGFASVSLLRETSVRLAEKVDEGKEIHLIYCGDFDPSGLDMDRDIKERLSLFAEGDYVLEFKRIALLTDQIETWRLPPNPAKKTDSRYQAFALEHGRESWELDAIKAQNLADLVRREIVSLIDEDLWREAQEQEAANKDKLSRLTDEL